MILKNNKYIRNIRAWLAPIRLWRDYYIYQFRLPKLKNKIFSKEKIKVVFFPINIGMWKNDYLFQLMLKHPRFDPYIVSFFVPVDSWEFQLRNQSEMKDFFMAKGYPYFDMYDEITGKWFDVNTFKPDIVFYTQAVDVAYPQYKIKALWKNSIFYYTPYCIGMEDQRRGYNTLLDNICVRFFAPSEYHKKEYSSFFLNKGKNVVFTGFPSFDYLTHPKEKPYYNWKGDDKRKRIIWAPHHSITTEDLLSYSNFLSIADEMVDLAKKYQDNVQFVFKPHPRLRPKLEQMEGWGEKRTAEYYDNWANMPNTCLEDGEYFNMFLTSDAMIHDSSTFMGEYLLTGKPIMFVLREDAGLNLNKYAQQCFNQHYIGYTMADIENFINNVVIGGEDLRKDKRVEFVHNTLLPQGNNSVAQNIFNEIVRDLK